MKALTQPSWFSIRDLAKSTWYRRLDLLFFTLDHANLETLILWSEEHLMSMETKESFGGILSG